MTSLFEKVYVHVMLFTVFSCSKELQYSDLVGRQSRGGFSS